MSRNKDWLEEQIRLGFIDPDTNTLTRMGFVRDRIDQLQWNIDCSAKELVELQEEMRRLKQAWENEQ